MKFNWSKKSQHGPAGDIVMREVAEGSENCGVENAWTLRLPPWKASDGNNELFEIAVRFTEDVDVPFPFRGRSLQAKVALEPQVLALDGNKRALATCERGPVWTISDNGGVKHFQSGFSVPELAADGDLKDILNEERFLEMIPLVHWLKAICADAGFVGPPLRASFMFDDPNLHWPRYGLVSFREIATRAAKNNYHVSFATIPLDSWFTHAKAAEIFRSNTNQVSLCVHGNNHTKAELARNLTEMERLSLLRQAIHRIEKLERDSGLRVCRVMVPPHGAFSEAMLADLPRCGFEAACVSHGSLRAHLKSKVWTRSLGFSVSELIHGCPVLPRWGFTGSTANSVLLAAFLNQPIILRGHHQDLRNGIELLDQFASFINCLGPVRWSNLTELSRANFAWRMEGDVMIVKPRGRKVRVQLPREARLLVIVNVFGQPGSKWHVSGGGGFTLHIRSDECVELRDGLSGVISLEIPSAEATSTESVSTCPATGAVIRRLLTEGRDRLRAML